MHDCTPCACCGGCGAVAPPAARPAVQSCRSVQCTRNGSPRTRCSRPRPATARSTDAFGEHGNTASMLYDRAAQLALQAHPTVNLRRMERSRARSASHPPPRPSSRHTRRAVRRALTWSARMDLLPTGYHVMPFMTPFSPICSKKSQPGARASRPTTLLEGRTPCALLGTSAIE